MPSCCFPPVFRRCCVVAFAACSSLALAQTPAPQATAPAPQPAVTTLSVTTREVLLDVLVTDGYGRPVTGLQPSDFTLTEEGTPQTIRSVREHHPMTAAELAKLASAPALPQNTFTNYTPLRNTNASTVILLDALDTPITAQMLLREQVIAYLKNMPPGASIAIFQLDTEMRLIQGFSSDQQTLLAAAKSKRDMPSLRQPINGSNEQYRRARREILRDGMQMLGRYLAGFPGRKNLIWFTGEVPLNMFGGGLGNPFRDSFSVRGATPGDLDDLADVLTLSRVAVYPIDSRGLEVDPAYDVSAKGRPSTARFNARQAFDHFDLDTVASMTGGRAYYNTNGLKDVIGEIVDRGSNYYTLAYSTTNKEWNGQLRRIKVVVDRQGVTLQHRQGYYAYNRDAAEQRQLAALQKRKEQAAATSASAAAASQPAPPQPQSPSPPETAAAATPDAAADDTGAMVHHSSKAGLAGAMALGAVAPTEIVFTARLAAEDTVAKLDKHAPPPPNTFLRPPYDGKPFRTYKIHIQADARKMKLTQTADGIHHGTVEFVAVVYDQSGETVNSQLSTASLDLNDATYRQMLQTGFPATAQIAVPAKGNFFLRLGVHDVGGDQIGAIEIPVDQVKLGAAGAGVQTP